MKRLVPGADQEYKAGEGICSVTDPLAGWTII